VGKNKRNAPEDTLEGGDKHEQRRSRQRLEGDCDVSGSAVPEFIQDTENHLQEQDAGQKKTHVYRVRGLPLEFDQKRTCTLLSNLLELNDGTAMLKIRSFAEALDGETRVATLSFQKTPPLLSGRRTRSFVVPDSLLRQQVQNDGHPSMRPDWTLTIDDHLLGFTVLSCPDMEQHKVEYVKS
jgi:hypothetical protein